MIDEGTTKETVCHANTSVGVNPVWLVPTGEKADHINTTCQDAKCFCPNVSAGVFFVRITNETREFSEGTIISNHSLILFICNASQSFNGSYTCLVDGMTNDFVAVNRTFELVVDVATTPITPHNHSVILSVAVAGAVLLVVVLVICGTIAGCWLYVKTYFRKSREDRVVDLPIPGHLTPYCYDLITDNMEFPRDSLIQLELLG